jgi:hypothetical protein
MAYNYGALAQKRALWEPLLEPKRDGVYFEYQNIIIHART